MLVAYGAAPAMKLPLVPTGIGVLAAIAIYFALQPYLDTAVGTALLFIICILVANVAAWAMQAMQGRGK